MERACDLKEKTREGVTLPMALLVYLASLRDHNTGCYHHDGWKFELSEEGADQALREFHREEFEHLPNCTVRELAEELGAYFRSLEEPAGRSVMVWRELESFRVLVPEGCHPVDRELFYSSLRAALAVLAVRAPSFPWLPRAASPPLSPAQIGRAHV